MAIYFFSRNPKGLPYICNTYFVGQVVGQGFSLAFSLNSALGGLALHIYLPLLLIEIGWKKKLTTETTEGTEKKEKD